MNKIKVKFPVAKRILFTLLGTILFFCLQSFPAYAEDLIIDVNTTWASGTYAYDDVHITNGAKLVVESDILTEEGITLNVQNLTIDAGSSIDATGQGYPGGEGPGAGGSYDDDGLTVIRAGGAGYGGNGGNAFPYSRSGVGGPSYGSSINPSDLGSGGGNATYLTPPYKGSSGGGVVRINCLGILTVNGQILSNGNNNATTYHTGGGAGGSINITTNSLVGIGSIAVDGGNTGSYAGGGAGGRIAIYYTDNTGFIGAITAYGGSGYQYGAAGTVFTKSSTQIYGDLVVDNNSQSGAVTLLLDETYELDTVTVAGYAILDLSENTILNTTDLFTEDGGTFSHDTGTLNVTNTSIGGVLYMHSDLTTVADIVIPAGGILYLNASLTVPNLIIEDGGTLTHSAQDGDFNLTVTNDLTVLPGGKIDATGQGYPGGEGPGAGGSYDDDGLTVIRAGGAGYGGNGGNAFPYSRSGVGGPSYGSSINPSDLGSGGGNATYLTPPYKGSSGGGVVRINCLGILTVNGQILSNGNNNATTYHTGGGAGGSINITTNSLVGIGSIAVDGGNTGSYAGGGAGGRIAIYYTDNTGFIGAITAYGGSGYQYGEDGTIYLEDMTIGPVTGSLIQTAANHNFVLPEDTYQEFTITITNTDTSDHVVFFEIINPYPEVYASFDYDTISISSNETINTNLLIDTAHTSPGVYDLQLKVTNSDDGSVTYSNLNLNVTASDQGDLPDLTVINGDISFSDPNPEVNEPVTLIARIHNIGFSGASDVKVDFYATDEYLGSADIDNIGPNSVGTAFITVSFAEAQTCLVRVVIDPDDTIQEYSESNNEAGQILQIGSITGYEGNILVTATIPSNIYTGTSFKVAGNARYQIYVNGEWNTDYVVKGGAVTLTVTDENGEEWLYEGVYTDSNGYFQKYISVSNEGDFQLTATVSDKTFTGSRELFFPAQALPQVEPPPPLPPTSSGGGSWVSSSSSDGTWDWEWTELPVHEPIIEKDLYVYSEDILFSNDNPALDEEITILVNIHFWATSTAILAEDIGVNVYVTYPGFPKMRVGQTIIDAISVGMPDFGSRYVYASWKNRAEGIYIIETEIVPLDSDFEEENILNNAATRAIIVGDLLPGVGLISGHVNDPWGGVSGVPVYIENDGYGQVTITGSDGGYLFEDVPIGEYQVWIDAPSGYIVEDMEIKPVTVDENFISEVDFYIIIVDDTGPVVSDVILTPNPTPIGGAVNLEAIIDDSAFGNSNIQSVEYRLNGGDWISMSPVDGSFDSPIESVIYSFNAPATSGIYDICLRGIDVFDNVGPEECSLLVVYDPEGGFVTGGGWIDSPVGAYLVDPLLAGRATFGFVSKYKKGATVPTGNTEFQFHAGDLNFHSSTYDWLVVAGAKAMFKGVGTINGVGNYGFMLSAIDGKLTPSTDIDLFRIKIWNREEDALIYDNLLDAEEDADPTTQLQSGNIIIHK